MSTAPHTGNVVVFPIHKTVAAEIRAWKARLQITQEELARVLDVSQQGISRRLNGHTPFTLDEVGEVAAYFRVHPSVLLGGSNAPTGPGPMLPHLDSNQEPAGYRHLALAPDRAA